MQTASFSKPAVNPAGFSASDAVSAAWSDGAAARSGHGAAFDVALFRIAGRAAALDSAPAFPAEDMAELHRAGLLLAPLPEALGGSGWGTSPEGAAPLLTALRRLGAANLSVGRLYEAHVNAVVLISAYGRPEQVEAAARDAEAGHCFGLWVTDGAAPLRLSGGLLIGGKAVCSGAGHISRALVTAMLPDGSAQMALVAPQLAAPGGAGDGSARLTGMHAAVTGAVAMTGLPADPLGKPGDYLREPFFSAGAWRTAAVTLGGLERLVHCVGAELGARGRADNPHQRARFGRLLVLAETASLWLSRTAELAEARSTPAGTATGYVNLARAAVEQVCLEALSLAQRSLGLNAFIAGREVERLMRDLATYLRQPAADEALCEAAQWFLARGLPR